MLDLLIRGGTLVDGSGAAPVRADVGVRDGRIAAIGEVQEPVRETFDATGLVVTPGFIDPHTHYDAQLFWDPFASPSNLHGVTTVIGGNCGFTLAPLAPPDADYTRRMMAKVEGMPLPALEQGLSWDWESFDDYLGRLDGRIGVNAGFLVGHCALRRVVMGADAVGVEASPEQIKAMARLLHESIEAGGLGFSTSRAFTHTDWDAAPVPSRWASHEEVIALCRVLRDHEGTALEFILDGCLKGFSDEEIELMAEMSLAAQRPANWNVLTVDAGSPERFRHQLACSDRVAERGGRIVALTMPTVVGMCMNFLTHCALHSMPGWDQILTLPIPERMTKLREPAVRTVLDERARSKEAGVLAGLANWGRYRIGDTFSPANEGLSGRMVSDIARERGTSLFDTLIDVVLEDELRTVLWPAAIGDNDESWALRAEVWERPDILLGGSDAGAHLDRMCGSPYPSQFLADCIRGRKLVPLERAVALMTQAPAALFGLRDRGRVAVDYRADLVVLDPETVGAGEILNVNDLPGENSRLIAKATGIRRVFVNGCAIVSDGESTGQQPGTLLRSGRDRTRLLLTLAEGRNRQIRRMMLRVGHKVRKLRRVQLGPLELKGLRVGQWRDLTPREVERLRRQGAKPRRRGRDGHR